MLRRTLVSLALLWVSTVPLRAQTTVAAAAIVPAKLTPAEEARFLALGKEYTRWFLAGKADSLLAVLSPETVEKVGGIEGLREQMAQVADRAGIETKVVEEKLTRRKGQLQFWHAGQFSEVADDLVVIRWLLDRDGKITGAGLGPLAQTPPPDPE